MIPTVFTLWANLKRRKSYLLQESKNCQEQENRLSPPIFRKIDSGTKFEYRSSSKSTSFLSTSLPPLEGGPDPLPSRETRFFRVELIPEHTTPPITPGTQKPWRMQMSRKCLSRTHPRRISLSPSVRDQRSQSPMSRADLLAV